MSRCIGSGFAVLMVVGVCIIRASVAWGQPSPLPACSPSAPHFCADASYFLNGDSYELEVYFKVCNEGLQFVRVDDGYAARADVAVVVIDDRKRQVTGDTYRVNLHAAKYAETTSLDSCETRTASFKAPPGEFQMAVTVRDGDSGIKSRVTAAIEIPSLDGRPALSDISFLSENKGQAGKRWEGFEPNVRRTYDSSMGDMAFYYEIYHDDGGDSVTVAYEVTDKTGAKAYEASEALVGRGTTAHLKRLPVDSLSNGRHVLTVSIVGPEDKVAVSLSKEFGIRSASLYFGKDAEEAAAILTYIAGSNLIERFLEADVEERKRIWERFWREKDPTPRTPRNEFYEEHLRRFRYANENFSTRLFDGWRTDRGRIYILHGEPDEIESYPMEIGRNPMEIWFYFGRNARFVFVDETGFGDYVLIQE